MCASPLLEPDGFRETGLPSARKGAERRRTGLALAVLLLVWLGHTTANALWLAGDAWPPYYDAAGHAIAAIEMYVCTGLLGAALGPPLSMVCRPSSNWSSGNGT